MEKIFFLKCDSKLISIPAASPKMTDNAGRVAVGSDRNHLFRNRSDPTGFLLKPIRSDPTATLRTIFKNGLAGP